MFIIWKTATPKQLKGWASIITKMLSLSAAVQVQIQNTVPCARIIVSSHAYPPILLKKKMWFQNRYMSCQTCFLAISKKKSRNRKL